MLLMHPKSQLSPSGDFLLVLHWVGGPVSSPLTVAQHHIHFITKKEKNRELSL